MKHLPFLIICICLGISLHANTVLPSVISENTVLTKANSPYSIATSFKVNAGINLTIEAGVIINIAASTTLTISGNIYCKGTETDSITFNCSTAGKSWAILNFSGTEAIFKYTNIRSAKRFISATGGNNIQILHCKIESTAASGNGDDCIAAHDTKIVTIDNIILKGAGGKIANGIKNDAIDLDALDSCFITNSIITNFSDDAIDIGTETKYAYIAFNDLSKSNYGITIGESSIAFLYRNICSHNDGGIQVHNKSVVHILNNTLYANTYGIECYHSEESNPTGSGGIIFVSNTIFSANTNKNIITVSSSEVNVNHSITDKETLVGNNNLIGNAMLVNPENSNYTLQAGSVCIDAGEADSLQAFIGNATDIGAIEYTGSEPTFVKNNELIDIQIFPNPAITSLHYTTKLNNAKSLEAFIFNVNGQLVKQFELNGVIGTISLEGLPKGLYNFTIESSGVRKESKLFVIQ